jgi:hypothetical protein
LAAFASDKEMIDFRTKVMSVHLQKKLQIFHNTFSQSNTCAYQKENISPYLINKNYSQELFINLVKAYKYINDIKGCSSLKLLAQDKINTKEMSKFNFAYKSMNYYCAAKDIVTLSPVKMYSQTCVKSLKDLFNELDPHCRFDQIASKNGVLDGNACMAGYKIAMNELITKDNYIDLIFKFAFELDRKIKNGYTLISPWTTYKDVFNSSDSVSNKRYFLAMMTFFYAASTNTTGMTDRFYEVAMLNDIKNGESAGQVVANYHDLKNIKTSFNIIKANMNKENIELNFRSKKINSYNRHNLMSMFLSCFYTIKKGKKYGKQIPLALGIAYEGKDFISHLKNDGVDMNGLKLWNYGTYFKAINKAYKGFMKDVKRYEASSNTGVSFCSK